MEGVRFNQPQPTRWRERRRHDNAPLIRAQRPNETWVSFGARATWNRASDQRRASWPAPPGCPARSPSSASPHGDEEDQFIEKSLGSRRRTCPTQAESCTFGRLAPRRTRSSTSCGRDGRAPRHAGQRLFTFHPAEAFGGERAGRRRANAPGGLVAAGIESRRQLVGHRATGRTCRRVRRVAVFRSAPLPGRNLQNVIALRFAIDIPAHLDRTWSTKSRARWPRRWASAPGSSTRTRGEREMANHGPGIAPA